MDERQTRIGGKMDIRDFIDLHVHIGPEPIPRKYTLPKLVREERRKLGGVA